MWPSVKAGDSIYSPAGKKKKKTKKRNKTFLVLCVVWWCTPVILGPGRLKQEHC